MRREGLGARVRVRGNRWLLVGAALTAWGITACAGTGGRTPGPPAASSSPGAASTASIEPGPPLSAQALKAIALTGDDVAGTPYISLDVRSPDDPDSNFPPASDATCQTLLDAVDANDAATAVDQNINWLDSIWPGGATLASYAGTGAEKAFDRARTSLTTCHDFTGVGFTGKYAAHVEPEKIPHLGDESIAFRITVPVKQAPGLRSGRRVSLRNEQHILVRVGGVTGYFTMLAMDRKDPFPLALVEREVARMTKAQQA
ncbi:hypothetical protein [Streptomyces sp. NPDC060027]|uniref:hypothetical protein n=1 Tax=Streptomyces sp. NPDC060027 TaxID=3347040 RepID=UPI0036919B39